MREKMDQNMMEVELRRWRNPSRKLLMNMKRTQLRVLRNFTRKETIEEYEEVEKHSRETIENF